MPTGEHPFFFDVTARAQGLRTALARIAVLRRAYRWMLSRFLRLRQYLYPPPDLAPGVDLLGYLRSENGTGEAARLAAQALQAADIPFSCLDASALLEVDNRVEDWAQHFVEQATRRVTLLHINGSVIPRLPRLFAGRGLFRGQYVIGVWHWELPRLSQDEMSGFDFVDELWAPSRFIEAALRASAPKRIPIIHMPHAVQLSPDRQLSRRDLGMPEQAFVFSSLYDARSYPERKNPAGALAAFQQAFAPDDSRVFLLLKANQGSFRPEALAALRQRIEGWTNIALLDRSLSRAATQRLIQLSDAVLSLHRSEGYGLVMAEAMAMGRVAVATGYSGNMDFMDESNSLPLPYQLKAIEADIGVYEAGQFWAEPDLQAAAAALRRLIDEPGLAVRLGQKAAADMQRDYSPEAIGARMRQRLKSPFQATESA